MATSSISIRDEGIVAVLMVGSISVETSAGDAKPATKGICSGSFVSGSRGGGGYKSSGVVDGDADLAGWAIVDEALALTEGEVEGAVISPTVVGDSSLTSSPTSCISSVGGRSYSV